MKWVPVKALRVVAKPLMRNLALVSLLALSVQACSGIRTGRDLDPEPKDDWIESAITLPPYPALNTLIEFHLEEATNGVRYYVDPASISIGNDKVVRYTLVAIGAGGAVNVSYEGIHCVEAENKQYAFGRNDKTWVPAAAPEWKRIEVQNPARYQGTLYMNFFCLGRSTTVATTQDAIARLKRGGPLIPGLTD